MGTDNMEQSLEALAVNFLNDCIRDVKKNDWAVFASYRNDLYVSIPILLQNLLSKGLSEEYQINDLNILEGFLLRFDVILCTGYENKIVFFDGTSATLFPEYVKSYPIL